MAPFNSRRSRSRALILALPASNAPLSVTPVAALSEASVSIAALVLANSSFSSCADRTPTVLNALSILALACEAAAAVSFTCCSVLRSSASNRRTCSVASARFLASFAIFSKDFCCASSCS